MARHARNNVPDNEDFELQMQLAEVASQFAIQVIDVLRATRLSDLAGLAGLTDSVAATSAVAEVSAPVAARATRSWPSCSVGDCGKRCFPSSGKLRLCYEHYRSQGGKHPNQRS